MTEKQMDVESMSMEEVENYKIEKEKELKNALMDQAVINAQLNSIKTKEIDLKRQLNHLSGVRHEYKQSMDKSKYYISCIRQDIKILNDAFWRKRNGY